jgi:hypothetical protein
MIFVVVAPLLVIVCNVAVVADAPGQFVPLWRQTFCPLTRREEPDADVKAKIVDVA